MLAEPLKALYLQRLGVKEAQLPADPFQRLNALHHAHLLAIPFENLDITYHRQIMLDDSLIFNKLVNHHRGGFCYELNYGFYMLLCTLGYDVTLVEGQIFNGEYYGPPFEHMVLLVTLERQQWLCDVGFGDSFLTPLPLSGTPCEEFHAAHKVVQRADDYQLLRREPGQTQWQPVFIFSDTPQELEDFAAMADYQQHSEYCYLTQQTICSRATETGRVSLRDTALLITEQRVCRRQQIPDAQRYEACLQEYFGIQVPQYNIGRWFAEHHETSLAHE